MRNRTRIRLIVGIAIVLLGALAGGCDSEAARARTADEIEATIAEALVTGIERRGTSIRAERFDPVMREFRSVRVRSENGLMYAERARLAIDPATQEVRLRLFEVLVAAAEDEAAPDNPTRGRLVEYREIELDPINWRR